uniref:Uncharacterized protein n=1 Tax=Wuchereria bancrofti TaxID=6293 RepID=A0AAF5Q3X4_WUCBA
MSFVCIENDMELNNLCSNHSVKKFSLQYKSGETAGGPGEEDESSGRLSGQEIIDGHDGRKDGQNVGQRDKSG